MKKENCCYISRNPIVFRLFDFYLYFVIIFNAFVGAVALFYVPWLFLPINVFNNEIFQLFQTFTHLIYSTEIFAFFFLFIYFDLSSIIRLILCLFVIKCLVYLVYEFSTRKVKNETAIAVVKFIGVDWLFSIKL